MTTICEIAKQTDLDALREEFNTYKDNTEKQLKYLYLNINACMSVSKIKFIANKFHISNLPSKITETILFEYFSNFGKILNVQIINNKPKFYAFITYDKLTDKDKLLFNKHKLLNNNLKVLNAIQKNEVKQDYYPEHIVYNLQPRLYDPHPRYYDTPPRYYEPIPRYYDSHPRY
jgi:hypothetical protein